MPACNRGTLTNALPYWDAMPPKTGHDTPPCHNEQKHMTNLSLYYLFMRNGRLEATTNHFNVLAKYRIVVHFLLVDTTVVHNITSL